MTAISLPKSNLPQEEFWRAVRCIASNYILTKSAFLNGMGIKLPTGERPAGLGSSVSTE